MIKNLVFDFGRVLVNYDFEHVIRTFFDNEEEMRPFVKFLSSQQFVDECDIELVPFKEIIREKQALYPQWERPLQLFHDRYMETVTGEMPGMRAALTMLKERGFKLYGLSNWCSLVHQVMAKYPIFGLLDGHVVSSEEHLLKPDVAIYQRLLEKYCLAADECLFADDKPVNVEGAMKAGMHAVVFTDAESYLEKLRYLTI